MMSPQYADALEKFRRTSQEFRAVQTAYRAKQCDDETYLTARKAYLQAHVDLDVAEAAE